MKTVNSNTGFRERNVLFVIIYAILAIIVICVLTVAMIVSIMFYTNLPVVGKDNLTRECVYVEHKGLRQACDGPLPDKYITVWISKEFYLENELEN